MNGAAMINPTSNHGAGPCWEGQTQKGAYFAGNRAHVIISKYNLITHILIPGESPESKLSLYYSKLVNHVTKATKQ